MRGRMLTAALGSTHEDARAPACPQVVTTKKTPDATRCHPRAQAPSPEDRPSTRSRGPPLNPMGSGCSTGNPMPARRAEDTATAGFYRRATAADTTPQRVAALPTHSCQNRGSNQGALPGGGKCTNELWPVQITEYAQRQRETSCRTKTWRERKYTLPSERSPIGKAAHHTILTTGRSGKAETTETIKMTRTCQGRGRRTG